MTGRARHLSTAAVKKKRQPPPEHFLNRELGLLAFNARVLEEAENRKNPLLERLRFLCIVSSNLDEFFEIRVGGLKEQITLGAVGTQPDGIAPRQLFPLVAQRAHEIVERQYRLLNDELLPGLAAEGICFLRRSEWTPAQQEWVRAYFFREVMPVLTPIGLDPAHPFPRVLNKSLNFAVELEGKDAFGRKSGAAIVQAPRVLPRVVRLPPQVAGCPNGFVFLSAVLHANMRELFAGMQVLGSYQFRVTRNSDLFVDEEEVKNLRIALQGELPQRHFGNAVRLEVADNCSEAMTAFLRMQFNLGEDDIYRVPGPVNLVRLMQVPDWVDRPDLMFKPFTPGVPSTLVRRADVFEAIRRGDILLHHPFQSFAPVVDYVRQAAADPAVVAIKQTIYRTGNESVLMETLVAAARSGKEVTVIVELLARFDEEANIGWASKLEQAGAHVVYGVVGHKTHAKMSLVVRREEGVLRRYVHVSTGNYHVRTAGLYTDFGLFTCNEQICSDVNETFKQLTGLGRASRLHHLWQAPFTLQENIVAAINEEAKAARAGKRGQIVAKMNALLEPQTIEALYKASQAGVKIDLIVRGVCALRPGVPGLSEHIRVRTILPRCREHSRIFWFHAGGKDNVYLSSADWMDRNFFRRVEICVPILDLRLKRRMIAEALRPYLRDNLQSWEMNGDGVYRRRSASRARPYSAQQALLAELAQSPLPDTGR
ncbi:MAG: polyphosphate kinase 1 [Betaproteobacteria bacterium]|nr:polyphosphate kinase 1 [Betaproteobacteria bacterium]